MQNVSAPLLAILESSERDLIDVYEFFEPDVTDLDPTNAALRLSSTRLTWDGNDYERQAITRGNVSRFVNEKFNTVSITLSNIDRAMSEFIADAESLEGWRVRVRTISRSVDNDSLVLFVGRCEKAHEVGNTTVQINAKQDLGAVENSLPWSTFGPRCQVADGFKGVECLAGEVIGDKSATYQAATSCDFTRAQCTTYDNLPAIQAFQYNQVFGNFKVSERRGGAGGALLGLVGIASKRVTKQWSSQDDMPWGKPVPMGFGRTQNELIVVKHADTGEYLAAQYIVGEGELAKLLNVRNVSKDWAFTFQAYAEHLGKYGTDPTQASAGFFATTSDTYSHRGYIEITILGSNPDTGDPPPTIVAVVCWLKIPTWNGTNWNTVAWSDKGPEIVRYLLTEKRSLDYNAAWIDDASFAKAVEICDKPLIDTTGGDDIYISTSAGTPGTDYKRYRTTGLLDRYHFRYLLGLDTLLPAAKEATVNTFSGDPPTNPTPTTRYRRQYTSNVYVKEKVKVADFLFKTLLPSFQGYLVTSAAGKLQLRVETPPPTSLLRTAVAAGATALAIEDAKAWLDETLPVRFALVGVGLTSSETARVSSVTYSTAGNSITLSATGATASGATLSGGNTTTQASATVTVSGTSPSVTIDGVTVSYTGNGDDTTATAAAMLAVMVNANTTLNRYVEAVWGGASVVTIKSKLGTLNLAAGVEFAHAQLETIQRIHYPFSSHAFGALSRGNILRDSFSYPLGSRQSSYNRFILTYFDAPQDYQEVELRENDFDHQKKINKTNDVTIDGTAVDNYHQADRLVKAARFKYRDSDFFCSWSSAGLPLLLEEGDHIAIQHDAMRRRRNLPCRLEEVHITSDHKVAFIGRRYGQQPVTPSPPIPLCSLHPAPTPPYKSTRFFGFNASDTGNSPGYTFLDAGKMPVPWPNTLMFWVRVAGANHDTLDLPQTFIQDGSAGLEYLIGMTDSASGHRLRFRSLGGIVGSSLVFTDAIGSPLNFGQWYHVAVVSEAGMAAQRRIYLNGILDITTSGDPTASPTIFEISNAGTANSSRLRGSMCAVKLWGAVLTPSEIAKEMESYFVCRADNLYAAWPMHKAEIGERDYGPNCYDLLGPYAGATFTSEDGPGIPFYCES